MLKHYCPKCERFKYSIRYGKFTLFKDNKVVQRVRCSTCGKTGFLAYQHPFLNNMHTTLKKLHEAIVLYSNGSTIKDISKHLKKRPNTIIDWVRKVKRNLPAYRACLIFSGYYKKDEIVSVLYSFKERAIKKRHVSKHRIGAMPLSSHRRNGRAVYY